MSLSYGGIISVELFFIKTHRITVRIFFITNISFVVILIFSSSHFILFLRDIIINYGEHLIVIRLMRSCKLSFPEILILFLLSTKEIIIHIEKCNFSISDRVFKVHRHASKIHFRKTIIFTKIVKIILNGGPIKVQFLLLLLILKFW